MNFDALDNNTSYNPYSARLVQEKAEMSVKTVSPDSFEQPDRTIHNAAVDLSISMESIKVFLNFKSMEVSKENSNMQGALLNLINNTELYNFFSGNELDNGMSLSSIGYTGKPITALNPQEAKDLVGPEGFFGVDKTSSRVSDFVLNMSGNNLEALQESRKGIVQGFEEAEKMWGGKLPDISYETQSKTLGIIDEKIAELMKTDLQKEVDGTE